MPNSPVTPLKIATWGHVSEIISTQLQARKMSMSELATALGTSPTAVHNWVRCQNAPSENFRKALAKFFELPLKDFAPRAPGKALKPLEVILPANLPKSQDVLSFVVSDHGTCRLRMDVILPLEHGIPLFRVLLDSGLVKGTPKHESGNAT